MMDANKEFVAGVWVAIEYLVCTIDQPTMAREIILESGVKIEDFRKILSETTYEMEKLTKFLDEVVVNDD